MKNRLIRLVGFGRLFGIFVVLQLISGGHTLYAQNNENYRRDIAHDLNAVVPDNALNSDDVVEITVNPNWKVLQGIQFQVISNPSDIFSLSNNKLIIVSNTNLSPGNYQVSMKATDGQYFDNFIVNVMVVSANKSVFIDPSNHGSEDGSRGHPYNSIHHAAFKEGMNYFLARSHGESTDQTIYVPANILLGAYGKGALPVIKSTAYTAFQMEEASNNVIIRDIHIKHTGSRAIQINKADRITVDNCQLGGIGNVSAGVGIRSDGLTSYTKILNSIIDSMDSDGIYLECEYAEIAYNIITNISIKNIDGDGIQLNINAFKARVHHNYIDMGGFETIKGVIAISQGQAGGYSWDSYATIEYNIMIASSGYAGFGITSTGSFDTVRCNYIYVEKSVAEGNGINLSKGGYVENNLIKGWDRGIYTRGDDLKIYNNTITDCNRGIDANSTATHTLDVKNNIFNNIGSRFILSASINNTIIANYNLYSLCSAIWTIHGVDYSNFVEYRNAGFESKGYHADPGFVDGNKDYNLAPGSPCIDKGELMKSYDYNCILRPLGSSTDIGAFEFIDDYDIVTGSDPDPDPEPTGRIMVIYIDPDNASDPSEDGTLEHPFNSWSDITWRNNVSYLQKRNTVTMEQKINIYADSVTLGAYGVGELPVIESKAEDFAIRAYERSNLVIRDLNIIAKYAISCIYFIGSMSTDNVIENCKLEKSNNGIRAIDGKKITIRYNRFDNCIDAIYSFAEETNIFYNIFKNNQTAINISSYESSTNVYNNVFYENRQGISATYAEITLYNNIFYLANTTDKAISHRMDNLISDNNIFYPEHSGFISVADRNYNTLREYQQAMGLDINSLNKDPEFKDTNNDNFSVDNSSPAIDAGRMVGITSDFFGILVPYGDAPDIGLTESLEMSQLTGTGKPDIKGSDACSDALFVFPNPSGGSFRLTFEDAGSKLQRVSVCDISGKKVYENNAMNSGGIYEKHIDISQKPKGMYIVTVELDDHTCNQRLIIN